MNINFSLIESTLSNSYFFLLLVATIYYWFKIIFFSSTDTTPVLVSPTIINSQQKKAPVLAQSAMPHITIGFVALLTANILITFQLLGRWYESGHFPLSGLYESLIFLSWSILFIYLCLEFWTKTELLGIVISPLLLCIVGFTGFSLPPELQQSKPLVPALQSNWLFMHVSVMMLSYGALLFGSAVAITYVLFYVFVKSKNSSIQSVDNFSLSDQFLKIIDTYVEKISEQREQLFPTSPNGRSSNDIEVLAFSSIAGEPLSIENGLPLEPTENLVTNLNGSKAFDFYSPFFLVLDNLSYRTIGIGFCFLTLGILSGAVWANETWGSYWSWDPKETWALITWLTFAVYLHTRFLQGWKGLKPAGIASFGFFIIWICYLGVNLLGKGLHSYGFLTN